MLGFVNPPNMLPAMHRPISLVVIALACTVWADAAGAQMSQSDLLTRLDRLEATIRDLTGTIEQLQYRNQQLEQQVQQLQAQVQSGAAPSASATPPPPRPAAPYPTPPVAPTAPVIAAAPPPAAPIDQAPAAGGRGDAFNPALNPNAPGVPRPLGSSTTATEPPPAVSDTQVGGVPPRQAGAPLDLSNLSAPPGSPAPGGDLPPPPPANPSATGAMQATLPPANTPKDEYDLAYGYFLHKDYTQAANTFRDFLKQYPSDRLTPEAQYWLGESLFQSQQYRDAAEAFLAVSTKYDTAARAPDALLRLGMSLAAMGENEAACASLGEVLRKYPRASLNVKQSVDREQKRAHC
jgi:tol-pal system protein YbgF